MLHFGRPLNNRQARLLEKLSGFDSRVTVSKRDVNMRDLAALTAETGDEFAMFTRKGERLIIRGNSYMTNIGKETARQMSKDGWRWSGHTHPGIDGNSLIASDGDMQILAAFGMDKSVIYNSRGQHLYFERW